MFDYKLPRSLRRILRLQKSLRRDVLSSTPAEIEAFNRREFAGTRAFSRLFFPPSKNVDSSTFILPVENGAIAALLFEKKSKNRIAGLTPLIVLIHGGGWMLGNMDKYSSVASEICNQSGASVLLVDYRLSPRHKFPTAVEDCYEALLWAYNGARYWKIDPQKIYLLGDCAGGNLAASVSFLVRNRRQMSLAGQILLCPITDARLRTESVETYKDSPFLTSDELRFFVQNYQREPKDILDPLFSPALAKDLSRLPQTLILAAEIDPLLDDSRIFASELEEADSPVNLKILKGSYHGFILYPSSPGCLEALGAITQFVSGHELESVELISNKDREKRRRLEIQKVKKMRA